MVKKRNFSRSRRNTVGFLGIDIKALPDQIRPSYDSKKYQIKAFSLFESRLSLKAISLFYLRENRKNYLAFDICMRPPKYSMIFLYLYFYSLSVQQGATFSKHNHIWSIFRIHINLLIPFFDFFLNCLSNFVPKNLDCQVWINLD